LSYLDAIFAGYNQGAATTSIRRGIKILVEALGLTNCRLVERWAPIRDGEVESRHPMRNCPRQFVFHPTDYVCQQPPVPTPNASFSDSLAIDIELTPGNPATTLWLTG